VLQEIKPNTPFASLKAVRLLATYMQKEDGREEIVANIRGMLQDMNTSGDNVVVLVGATIFFLEENFEDAMRCVSQTINLEA
jgi:hypothetical protein